MTYSYKTKGTCSTQIDLELDGNVVHNVKFTGGCNGNLQAIPKLVEGLTVEQVEEKIGGIRCGGRGVPKRLSIKKDRLQNTACLFFFTMTKYSRNIHSMLPLFHHGSCSTGCICFPCSAASIVSGSSSIFATMEFGLLL